MATIKFTEDEVSAMIEELELELLRDPDELIHVSMRDPSLASAYMKIVAAYDNEEED